MKHQLQQIDEMLDLSLNHASIMTWGWFNEGPNYDESACPAYKAISDKLQARDPTRFRTWADDKMGRGTCRDHASLISWNRYPGWYNRFGNLPNIANFWQNAVKSMREAYPNKPFVVSETGAGGLYEWSDNETSLNLTEENAKWTQWYQTEVIAADVDVALAHPNISGITLWHFFDFKANDGDTSKCGPCEYIDGSDPPTCAYINVSCGRPTGANHKGVVDFWRREKQAYHVVAQKYNASLTAASAQRQSRSVIV